MAIGRDPRPRGGAAPARRPRSLEAVAATDLGGALDAIAELIEEVAPADLLAVEVDDGGAGDGVVRGTRLGPAARALGPLLGAGGADPIGLAEAARAAGAPVAWARLGSEPGHLARLGAIADAGGPAGALHRALHDAGGLAVPFGGAEGRASGVITLVNLDGGSPLPAGALDAVTALAPQVALIVHNHRLASRARSNRQMLEGVIASGPMGVIVSDLRGRLTLANTAAAEMLGIDLQALVGSPIRSVIDERVKWRFTNPEDYATQVLDAYDRPAGEARHDGETVDGRAVEYSSSPVRDPEGLIVGRVDILSDVTTARGALAEARRLAAERAGLLEREERRAHEEVALTRAAHMMASALTATEIHGHLLDQAHALVPGCEKSAVLTVDARGLVLPVVTRGFAETTIRKMTFRSGEGTVGRMMVDRRPFICNDTAVNDRLSHRITGPEGIRSFMLVPLVHGERVLGLVSLNCLSPREFREREVRLVTALARHAAAALGNALQFEQERHIAETLQQSLISRSLPEVPGLELAGLYQAAAGSQVGGDFYSAWTLGDGRLALLVGDVSGKGVEAAGVTAMVRYMAEALSRHDADPAVLVGDLNELLCPRLPEASLVTLVLVTIDTAAGALRWCSAGHPPPALLDASGRYRTLDDPDPPCGVFRGQRFHCADEPFRPGDTLLLYTDGLIEARRAGVEFGEARLREAVLAAAGEPVEALARSVHAAARTWCGGRLTDDVAVAVARRR